MEWTSTNKRGTKHHITSKYTEEGEAAITIIRLRTCGGVPKVIRKFYAYDITFIACMTKINIITELDEELFIMVAENT